MCDTATHMLMHMYNGSTCSPRVERIKVLGGEIRTRVTEQEHPTIGYPSQRKLRSCSCFKLAHTRIGVDAHDGVVAKLRVDATLHARQR